MKTIIVIGFIAAVLAINNPGWKPSEEHSHGLNLLFLTVQNNQEGKSKKFFYDFEIGILGNWHRYHSTLSNDLITPEQVGLIPVKSGANRLP